MASRIGPRTLELVEHLFSLQYPLQYLRRVQGILRLVESREFSPKDMEYGARAAMTHNILRLGYIKSCCEFHAQGGPRPRAAKDSMPLRSPDTLHLQKNRKAENEL